MTIIDNDTDLTALPFVVITLDKDTQETEYHGCKSASEVLDFVIDGYSDLDDTEALKARISLIEDSVIPVIAELIYGGYLAENGQKHLEQRDEEILLSRFKDDFGIIDWTHEEIPLIVASTQFSPNTDTPRPTGNVEIIEVDNELAVIRALASKKILNVMENNG